PRQRRRRALPPGGGIRFLGAARGYRPRLRLRSQVDLGHRRAPDRDLPMPGARRTVARPLDRADRARRLSRHRLPRLVPRRRAARSLRRPQRGRAQSAAGDHSRSADELVLPQGRARRRFLLRRADPGGRAPRLAAPHRALARPGAGGHRVRIVILYDPGAEDWTAEDIAGVMTAVDEVGRIFGALGHEVKKYAVRHDLRWFAACRRADLAFNLCEGVHGVSAWEEHVV